MSDDDIMAEVNKYPAPQIVLTGGEPSLWIDKDFISNLKKVTGKRITIETNGTRILPEGIDWVTVSPKLFVNMKDGSTRKYDSGLKVERADELKVVDIGQDLHSYFDLPCVDAHTAMLLQPCYVENEEEREKNTRRTLRRVLDDPRWRLSLQTHRYLKIP